MSIPEYSTPERRGCGRGCAAGAVSLAILIVAALWLASAYRGAYNGLVQNDEEVRQAWSEVEVNLSRRGDLIPNLVRTVQGAARQEQKVFGDIADARARLAGAGPSTGPSAARMEASNELSGALSRLLVLAENYPTLQSNRNFLALQDQLEGTENRLAHSRTEYNRAVQNYNRAARSFPMNLFLELTPFQREQPYFEAPTASRTAPAVDFGDGGP